MKSAIIASVNQIEYNNALPTGILDMAFDDLLILLRFIHKSSKKGGRYEPFFFTNHLGYLDLIWHHFILHTRLYYDFCMQEFGEFLHHDPETSGPKEPQSTQAKNVPFDLERQINLLQNELGWDFVNRIFFLYPEILKRESYANR